MNKSKGRSPDLSDFDFLPILSGQWIDVAKMLDRLTVAGTVFDFNEIPILIFPP